MKFIADFFKAYYTRQKDFFIERGSFNDYNYWPEVSKPSQITDSHFIEIEEKLNFKLPEAFKNLYKAHYSVNESDLMAVGGYAFEIPGSFSKIFELSNIPKMREIDDYHTHAISLIGNPEGADLKYLKQYLFENDLISHPNLLGQGLIPIGIVNHEWHICLDIRQDKKDPPIVLYSISFATEPVKAKSNKNWFSNFSCFMDCLTDYLKTGSSDNFNKIDPNNNYKLIYDFWNSKENIT
ncbi:SMI1/KNR4 family protein [Aquimarina sp. M1]